MLVIMIDPGCSLHYVFQAMKKNRKAIKRKIKPLIYPITFRIFFFIGYFFRKMSWQRARQTATILGDIAFFVLRLRRGLVEKNLAHTFPDKSLPEIRGIARKVYRNQTMNIIEMLRIPLIRDKDDARKLVEFKTNETLNQQIARGKGAVLVSGHFGSWELIGFCTAMHLGSFNSIVKPIKNKPLDKYLHDLRTSQGHKLIYKDTAARQGLKVLKNGELLGVLGDQSNKKGDVYVDFLGRKATIFMGPAFWSLKAGVPLFVELSKRLDNGKYLVDIQEIATSDLTYNREDIKKLTCRYTRILEDFIRKHPEEWLWLHDRWKHSPQ